MLLILIQGLISSERNSITSATLKGHRGKPLNSTEKLEMRGPKIEINGHKLPQELFNSGNEEEKLNITSPVHVNRTSIDKGSVSEISNRNSTEATSRVWVSNFGSKIAVSEGVKYQPQFSNKSSLTIVSTSTTTSIDANNQTLIDNKSYRERGSALFGASPSIVANQNAKTSKFAHVRNNTTTPQIDLRILNGASHESHVVIDGRYRQKPIKLDKAGDCDDIEERVGDEASVLQRSFLYQRDRRVSLHNVAVRSNQQSPALSPVRKSENPRNRKSETVKLHNTQTFEPGSLRGWNEQSQMKNMREIMNPNKLGVYLGYDNSKSMRSGK